MMRFALGGNVIGTLLAALLLLAGLGVVGTAAELAMERHWQGPWQLLPWLALGMIALALGVLLVGRTRPAVRFARSCAALVILTAAVGRLAARPGKLRHRAPGRSLYRPLGDDVQRPTLVGSREGFRRPGSSSRSWGAPVYRRCPGCSDQWTGRAVPSNH